MSASSVKLNCEPSRLKQAVGFFTHVFDETTRTRYLKLKRELPGVDTYIIAQMGTPVPEEFTAETHFYRFADLAARVPKILGESIVPGNCHLTMLEFAGRFPGYDYYWQVEYDVLFTGDWSTFFGAFSDDQSALLCSHLRTRYQEPGFIWWSPMEFDDMDSRQLLRAFLPVYRISKDGLAALNVAVESGAFGHFEALIPSVLGAAGLEVRDFGQGRFYTSCISKNGLMCLGTMRFRPDHCPWFLLGRDVLYHPVKSRWGGYQAFGLISLGRHLRREPLLLLSNMFRSLRLIVRSRVYSRSSGSS